MEADEKACPRCAETVKAAALVCKHCNYEFGTPIQSSAAVATAQAPQVVYVKPKKSHPFLIGCAAIVGFIVVLGIIGSLSGPSTNSASNSSDSSESSESSAPTPVAVTSIALAQAYNSNEVAAQKAFEGQTLDVTGTISGITLDLFNNPTIQMVGVNEFLPVQAKFDKSFGDKISQLSKGQQVTVRCTSITEVISAPMLDDCTLP